MKHLNKTQQKTNSNNSKKQATQKKKQTSQKRLQVNDVENNEEFVFKEQTARKELENFKKRSKPLEGKHREFR